MSDIISRAAPPPPPDEGHATPPTPRMHDDTPRAPRTLTTCCWPLRGQMKKYMVEFPHGLALYLRRRTQQQPRGAFPRQVLHAPRARHLPTVASMRDGVD